MARIGKTAILEVSRLKKYFPIKSALGRVLNQVKAVDDVSFMLKKGETYGLVGETGCGKTTIGRTILKLLEPTGGTIRFEGRDITNLSEKSMRPLRQKMQIVFQDPFTSLNPRKRIGSILMEPLTIHHSDTFSAREKEKRAMDMLDQVGLLPEHFYRFPHEFSGGQRQRIGLARALIQNPDLLICDEPVSALDVSVQAQIINLLVDIQRERTLSCLFIAHNLSVVKYISARIGVMYMGVLMEESPTDELFTSPRHPYTQALISAVPVPDPLVQKKRIILEGELPSPINTPAGCVFCGRCPWPLSICGQLRPPLQEYTPGHFVACHRQSSAGGGI
ncbi:MAG: ATP-binding cassette domain-containing protein [Treponema sp.]|jgi:peptide/nickel transport system ATP-binding protein/oligopeptide transport system ATP-binding protein|nr:ATP-binding cassette domain-containing protein [Treponema sp.]